MDRIKQQRSQQIMSNRNIPDTKMDIDLDNNLYTTYSINAVDVNILPLLNVTNANTVESQNTYIQLFQRLNNYYSYLNSKAFYRFAEFSIYTDSLNNIHFTYGNPRDVYGINNPIQNIVYGDTIQNPEDLNLICNHVFKMINDSKLQNFINKSISKKKLIRIVLDYYPERDTAQLIFHKDSIGKTFYVTLTYNNPSSHVVGPEVINCIDTQKLENFQRQTTNSRVVFRPEIPKPYGSVGFNDSMFAHSNPYPERNNVDMLFSESTANIKVETLTDPFNQDILKAVPSNKRKPGYKVYPGEKRPSFIRIWFEEYENNELFEKYPSSKTSYIESNPILLQQLKNMLRSHIFGNEFLEKTEHLINNEIMNTLYKNDRIVNISFAVNNVDNLECDDLNKFIKNSCNLCVNRGGRKKNKTRKYTRKYSKKMKTKRTK